MKGALSVAVLLVALCGPAFAQDPTPGPSVTTTIGGTQQGYAKIIATTATTVLGGTFTVNYANVGCSVAPVLIVTAVSGLATLLGVSTGAVVSATATTATGVIGIATALGALSLTGAGVTVNVIGACY